MSSLMVDFTISLDGYGAAEGWPGYWGMEGPEYLAWIKQDAEHEHTALLGATTYRLMSGFAAEMPDEPGLAALTAMPKVVFSFTLEAPLSWANTELVSGNPVETVQDMKRRESRPLRTIGSLRWCTAPPIRCSPSPMAERSPTPSPAPGSSSSTTSATNCRRRTPGSGSSTR